MRPLKFLTMRQWSTSFCFRCFLKLLPRTCVVPQLLHAWQQLLGVLFRPSITKERRTVETNWAEWLTVRASSESGLTTCLSLKMLPSYLLSKLPFQRPLVLAMNSSFKSKFQYLFSLYNFKASFEFMSITVRIPSSFVKEWFSMALTAYGTICSKWCIS